MLGREGDWYKVQHGEDEGYISAQFIRFSLDEAMATTAAEATTTVAQSMPEKALSLKRKPHNYTAKGCRFCGRLAAYFLILRIPVADKEGAEKQRCRSQHNHRAVLHHTISRPSRPETGRKSCVGHDSCACCGTRACHGGIAMMISSPTQRIASITMTAIINKQVVEERHRIPCCGRATD